MDDGGDYLGVAEGLQSLIPDVDGVLDGPLPVRVLVGDGGQDLREVVSSYQFIIR